MKKTIKKCELKRLVEGVLNELDWKTYMSAAEKNDDKYDRTGEFVDAARNAYKKKYGSEPEKDYISDYGYVDTERGKQDFEDTYGEPYWEPYDDDGRWIQGRTRTNFTNDYLPMIRR